MNASRFFDDADDRLTTGWSLASTSAGACRSPLDLPAEVAWSSASVPGTVAGALADLGRWSLDAPTPLHDRDHWYLTRLSVGGRRILRFEGLATFAEVFLDGRSILTSVSMYAVHEVEIEAREGAVLAIVFRSLTAALEGIKPKRARWRSTLVPEQRLRGVRTTLLGHMPGWCPPVEVIGPWRPIRLIDPAVVPLRRVRLAARLEGADGHLSVRLSGWDGLEGGCGRVICAGATGDLVADDLGGLVGDLVVPDVEAWWPHTHGTPTLHDVEAEIDGRRMYLGRVGFRRIAIDRDADGRGFGIIVNDVAVFSRGTVWSPGDMVRLPGGREAHAEELARIRDAGLNMVRVPGISVYEDAAFHALCDELGILVWQDLMFANFDYPAADPAFVDLVVREVEDQIGRLSGSPSLAVVCGGSEITQQAAMMGLPPASWANALFDEILPREVGRSSPGVAWVRSTPDGGAMPFSADTGITHYYGVGAYRRPLDDARRAKVRFAAECLAFAHVPEDRTLALGLPVPPGHHPRWKARVPRDLGAAWDFEDTRLHYETEIFGADAAILRQEDPARHLDVARAATAHVIEATIGEWRRPGSPTRGALVFLHKDPWVGAGWGLVDALGRPKSSWHALARASRPLALILCDEGVNGLDVHVVNDGVAPVEARLEITALADGRRPVVSGRREIRIEGHGCVSVAATDLFGGFFDTTRAYRFGPPAHDLTHARLVDEGGRVLAEAFHFPLGRTLQRRVCGLVARVEEDGEGFALVISAERAASSVVIEDDAFLGADDGFHLVPGERRVRLIRRRDASPEIAPRGRVRALDAIEIASYR